MTTTFAALTLAAAAASGAVNPIGPFVGEAYEGFEAIASPGSLPGPVDIFEGQGTVNDQFANNLVIATNLISFLTNEEIFPWNGNLMGLSVTGRTRFTFDTPATEFGGYFGTVDILSGGSIAFFDATGAQIESHAFGLPLNDWGWYGWSSDTPISAIEITANVNPGTPIVFDDLHVNFVPAPGAATLVGLALVATRRRR